MASNVTGGQQIKHFMLTVVLKDEFKHDIPIGNNFNVIYDNKDANLQVGDLLTKVDCESINHEMYLKKILFTFHDYKPHCYSQRYPQRKCRSS